MASAADARSLVELRLLDGPNLYFPRPAAKVTLDLDELLGLEVAAARDLGVELGLGNTRPGAAGSVFRQRFAIRLVTQIVRRLASAGGATRLAVRTRTGQAVNELVVAYPWRNAGRAEGLAYGLARVLDSVAAGPRAVAEMIIAEGRCAGRCPARFGSRADQASDSRGRDHRHERQDHDGEDDRPYCPTGRQAGGLVKHRWRLYRRAACRGG